MSDMLYSVDNIYYKITVSLNQPATFLFLVDKQHSLSFCRLFLILF